MRRDRAEAWARWRGLISEQDQSGKSVAAFCRERGLHAGQFYGWRKRLRQAGAAQFVEVGARAVRQMVRQSVGDAIEVKLGSGRSLVVEPGFDAAHLRALLDVLEAEA